MVLQVPLSRPTIKEQVTQSPNAARLTVLILANALLRVAGGAGGILVGLYLSDVAKKGARVDATVVGIVGAVSFGAELVASIPMGVLSDAIAPRG